MKNRKLATRISTFMEFNIKQVGLYTGLFFSLVVLPIFYVLDLTFLHKYMILDSEYYKTLTTFNNSLSSIIIAILLTTFSVVFVVMQLASSQFSPRILRYFMANDLKIQRFIGIYLGAISSIFLLQVFCPLFLVQFKLCLFTSLLLSFYCILFNFPNIIIHLNDNMNVATITNKIKGETIEEIENLYTQNWRNGDFLLYKRPQSNSKENQTYIFWNGNSGYLSEVNYSKLSELTSRFIKMNIDIPKFKIYQKPIVGEFIMAETTVVLIIEFEEILKPEAIARVRTEFINISLSIFQILKYRSYKQDINFGVRKLVDISIKAISPAVNDPTTCLNCIDYMGEIVRQLSIRKFPSTLTDELQNERIYINEFDFSEFVNFAFDQIFQWGKKDPVIVKRIIQTIYQILHCVLNPYNLKVLIKEIEDMELEKIYPLPKSDLTHTQEQIDAIHKELTKFKRKAKEQIDVIRSEGIFTKYELSSSEDILDLSVIRKIEIESIAYLEAYSKR